ncbi:MAG TPA: hypothetical protein VD789_00110 [Thermomicrobiales bacterium]|jgi:hypothetical protein|nr:hypothetical protein [Thermomicrobiales bacterium]
MLDQAVQRQRRAVGETRSYALTIVALNVYAAISAVIVLRTVLVAFDATESIWMGRFVFGPTSRVTGLLEVLPGATREVLGPFNAIDLSLVGLVLLFPLGMVASGGNLRRRR